MKRRLRARRGMTLLEVVVSLMILSTVLLGLGDFTARLSHNSSLAGLAETAALLASDRMDSVRVAPRYAAMESLYVATENTVAGYPDYRRKTKVRHVGGQPADTIDYRIVTVEVTHPQLAFAVRKTLIVAPF